MGLIQLVAAVLYIVLMWALTAIGRANELHHGYMGVVLLLAAPFLPPWSAVVGLVLLGEDTIQHAVEAFDLLVRHRVLNDWTPIHWLGVGVILLAEMVYGWFRRGRQRG